MNIWTRINLITRGNVRNNKIREQLEMARVKDTTSLNFLLGKFNYYIFLWVPAYIKHSMTTGNGIQKRKGLLTTEEITDAETYWIRLIQQSIITPTETEQKKDKKRIWKCIGRVQGYHSILLPRTHKLVLVIIKNYHDKTLHGGVSSTMSSLCENVWIPKLRVMVKRSIYECNWCQRCRLKPLPDSEFSQLPVYRTANIDPFPITGVDFAGPMIYNTKKKVLE